MNLATQDALKGIKFIEDTLDTVHEITKLINNLPNVTACSRSLIEDDVSTSSFGIHVLYPTCWTVRAEAIAKNYSALQLTWYAAKDAVRHTNERRCSK